MIENDAVVIRVEGRAGRITLNRPDVLNALTYPMIGAISSALHAWADDPAVDLVILDGAGDRALCAGGDVLSLYSSREHGPSFARRFWGDEYRLNAQIKHYRKPYVAVMDGIVMGGGIGLAGHARHRIVTERSVLAMPETAIGLIPDVGGTWLLAHAPGNTGIYLGLTGARMSGADAIFAGFADHYVAGAAVPSMVGALTRATAGEVDAILVATSTEAPSSKLSAQADEIDRTFSGPSMEAIASALTETPTPWASKTLADLGSKSPTALKVALAALLQARTLPSLEAALEIEYRLVTRLFECGEFIEGIRALLVDKDKAPKWRRATLAAVTDHHVRELLSELPHGEGLTFD